MSSFVSKTVGRFLLPNFEKDLTKVVHEGIQSSCKLTDCFLAPSVYGFEKACPYGLHATATVEQRFGGAAAEKVVFEKVHYPVPEKGLFR